LERWRDWRSVRDQGADSPDIMSAVTERKMRAKKVAAGVGKVRSAKARAKRKAT
jgi:hypothetical protein